MDDALTNAIGKLRKALDDNPRIPAVIEAIAKSGYRLIVESVPVIAAAFRESTTAAPATSERPSWPWWLLGVLLVTAAFTVASLNSRSPQESTVRELDVFGYRETAPDDHQIASELKEFEAALWRNPAHTRAHLWLAATLLKLGRLEDAAWQVDELLTLNPSSSLSRLLFAFPLKGPRRQDAVIDALSQLGLPE